MRREGKRMRRTMTVLLGMLVASGIPVRAGAFDGSGGASLSHPGRAEVSGVVRMPEICSPSVSPAVVYLAPAS